LIRTDAADLRAGGVSFLGFKFAMGVPAAAVEKAHASDLLDLAARYGVTLRRAAANEFSGG
jgi:hypothetical protein